MQLAAQLNAEIVSVDSMAVYRGMDIGTAKPTPDEQKQVPHFLLDVVDPNHEFSLAEYLAKAHAVANEIRGRGKQVLFVGGTPLYLKSLMRGVCEGPPADVDFRRAVEEEIEQVGLEALRERLEQVDPLSAAKLHPNDKRRMIRALEVYATTGTPISHYQLQFEQANQLCKHVFVLSWDRGQLHDRINRRVDRMYESGLFEEVRGLLAKYGSFSSTALQGVGYREVLDVLDGNSNMDEAIEQTKARTRQFARRQETWFRGLSESKWISVDGQTTDEELVKTMLQHS